MYITPLNQSVSRVYTFGRRDRVPVVRGGRLSYGADGALAVCDSSGFYMVQNLQDVRRLGDNTKPSYQGDGALKTL